MEIPSLLGEDLKKASEHILGSLFPCRHCMDGSRQIFDAEQ